MNEVDYPTYDVTRRITMSNGDVHTMGPLRMDDREVQRDRDNARALARAYVGVMVPKDDGTVEYLNPAHIVSINLTVVAR